MRYLTLPINGYRFEVLPDQAVQSIIAIAAGEWDEERTARWVADHLVVVDG